MQELSRDFWEMFHKGFYIERLLTTASAFCFILFYLKIDDFRDLWMSFIWKPVSWFEVKMD